MTKNYFLGMLLTGFMALLSTRVQAQNRYKDYSQQFTWGQVALTTGETLAGSVKLSRSEHASEVLTITLRNNAIRSLPAASVIKFEVQGDQFDAWDLDQARDYLYDFTPIRNGYYCGNPAFSNQPAPVRLASPDNTLTRVYCTYRWNRNNEYTDFLSYAFFEQLSSGPALLLRHETLELRHSQGFSSLPYGRSTSTKFLANEDQFFLGLPNGKLLSLRNPKDNLLTYFSAYKKQIEQFAKENKLGFKKPHELAYIVNYANSLAPQP